MKRSRQGKPWRDSTRKEFTRQVRKLIAPKLGKIQAAALEREDVDAFIGAEEKRGLVGATRTLQVLKLMYSYGRKARPQLVKASPDWPEPPSSSNSGRERVLSDKEVASFWAACEVEGSLAAEGFKLLLLLGQRRGETLRMRWSDLSEEADGWWWLIPGEFTKNGREHRVPLSPQASAIVEALRLKRREDSPWVFTSPYTKVAPRPLLSPQEAARRVWKLVELEEGKAKPTLHDLRRTLASGVGRVFGGSGRFVAKVILNHAEKDVTAIYDRLRRGRRDSLRSWRSCIENQS